MGGVYKSYSQTDEFAGQIATSFVANQSQIENLFGDIKYLAKKVTGLENTV